MKPYRNEEDKSYALPFLAASLALLLIGAVAVWREAVTLRPWKRLQGEYYSLEQEKLSRELRTLRRLAAGPAAPGGLVPSANAAPSLGATPSLDLSQAKSRVQALEQSLQESKHAPIAIQQIYLPEMGVVDRCKSCHVAIDRPESAASRQPFAAHPGQFLFLDRHSPDRMGCTVCHAGQGRATSSVEKAHGHVEHWDEPLLSREHTSASCVKCHGQEVDTLRGAATVAKGAESFRRYACYGCHPVAGYQALPRPGPPLRGVGEKINYSYLVRWIKSPRSVISDARMPDFGFTDQEARSIADFLFSLTRRERVDLAPVKADPLAVKLGKDLYNTSRCSICHRVDGKGAANQTVYAPDLTVEGSKIQSAEWIASRIAEPAKYYPDTVMPRFRFNDTERRQLAAYIASEFRDGSLDEGQLRSPQPILRDSIQKGKELVEKFGCFNCHEIPGFEKEGKIGADLTVIGSKPLERFDFAGLKIGHDRASWLAAKLKTPRAFRGELKMPNYSLPDAEIQPLTTFLLSLTGTEVPQEFLVRPAASDLVLAGPAGKLFQDLKCLTCHAIRGQGGKFAPDLSFEGSAVETAWLEKFLKAPDLIRPLLEQMPKFHLSDEEARILAGYIKATLVDPRIPETGPTPDSVTLTRGREIYERGSCRSCHQMKTDGGAVGPGLASVGSRLTGGYLLARTKDARSFRPFIVEPHYSFNEEQAAALAAYLKQQGGRTYVAKK